MKTEQVSIQRFWPFLTAIMLVDTFSTFPRGIALTASTAAPWALPVAGALAFLLIWPVLALLSRRPGQNLVDLCLSAGGRPMGMLLVLIHTAYVVAADGVILRQICEMAITAIYPHTPQTFLIAALLGTAALGAAVSPASLVWMGALYMLPCLISIGLVLLGNVGWGQGLHLIPITGRGLWRTATVLPFMTSYYGEFAFATIFAKYLCPSNQLVGGLLRTLGVVIVAWTAVVTVVLMVFSLPGGLSIPFPLFEMTRLVQGGRFLERLDGIWIIMWTFGSAGRITVALMALSLIYRDVFRLPSHRGAILPLGIAVLAGSLFPSNQQTAIWIESGFVRRWGFMETLLLPLLIAAIAWWRKERRHG